MQSELESYYWPDIPLDGVVDAALPESFKARHFNKLVDDFIYNHDETKKGKIVEQLTVWSANHSKLMPYIAESEKLKEIENISAQFSEIATITLKAIEANRKPFEQLNEVQQKLTFLENGENGVLLAVVPGLRILIMEQYKKHRTF